MIDNADDLRVFVYVKFNLIALIIILIVCFKCVLQNKATLWKNVYLFIKKAFNNLFIFLYCKANE